MNDTILSQRLRALRVPPPTNGLEARLREALHTEARVLAAATPHHGARRRAARRWTGRAGLTLAIALGASAAAAAAGWMSWAPREETGAGAGTPPAATSDVRSEAPRARRPKPAESSPEPAAPQAALEAVQPLAGDAPARVERALPSPPRDTTSRRARALTASPAGSERPSHAPHEPPPVKRPSAAALVPFELPVVDVTGPASPSRASAERGRGFDRGAPRAAPRQSERPLPRLERTPPERAERGKSEVTRERGRTPEPRGRENAERGLERARAAREKNGK